MKKFALKLLLFIPLTPAVIIGTFIENSIFNNPEYYIISKSVNYLILGNSHSECALNDSLIDYSINLSSSAESYFYSYHKLKKISESNPSIHTLILEYTNINFDPNSNDWIYGDKNLPYTYQSYSILMNSSDDWFLFKNNPSVFVRSYFKAFLNNLRYVLFNKKELYNKLGWGGYRFLIRDKIPELRKNMLIRNSLLVNQKMNTVQALNVYYLKEIVKYCKLNKIELILFRSPLHQLYTKNYETELMDMLKTDFKNIPFWDYSNYPLQDEEFGDFEHLNFKGAKRFSGIINMRLKSHRLQN